MSVDWENEELSKLTLPDELKKNLKKTTLIMRLGYLVVCGLVIIHTLYR